VGCGVTLLWVATQPSCLINGFPSKPFLLQVATMLSLFQSLSLLALASVSTAQLSISTQCTQALTSLATDSDVNGCLTLSPLLPIFTSPNNSVIAPIDNWLTSMCAAGACSNTTLAKIVTTLTSGCSTEIAGFGVQSVNVPELTQTVEQIYPYVREAFCLKDGNTHCITQSLTNIQSVTGTLNVPELESLFAGGYGNVTLPANLTCTNCAKATYNIFEPVDPSLIPKATVEAECGASFVDGTNPDGIVQTASGANSTGSQTSTSGSRALSSNGVTGLSALLLTFGAFAFLA
jgi:hypothetical protein